MEDKKIIDAIQEYGKIDVKTPTEEFILVKKSKYMATIEFVENILSMAFITSVVVLLITLL